MYVYKRERMEEEFYNVYPYTVPGWASHLQNIPQQKVKLSNLNTPIHEWHIQGLPGGFEVYIKRDDLTGSELSGNKVRNLQLLFAEALSEGCRHVVSGGPPQSGHCRAVSLVCRSLGLQPHIVIEGVEKKEKLGSKGNMLLYRLAGSQIYLAPIENYNSFKRRVKKMSEYISAKYNEKCYCIPIGGSAVKGVYGFISEFEELMSQGLHDRFDDIVVTVATGGTSAGLALGNYLTGSKLKCAPKFNFKVDFNKISDKLDLIHAVTIALTKDCLVENIDALLAELGVTSVKTDDILDIIEGYIGEKYGTATEEVLEWITSISSTTGILLDPYYTGKGAMGMVKELKTNPSRFKGTRILFIHTGGIFGLFNGEIDRVMDKQESPTSNIYPWPDIDCSPV